MAEITQKETDEELALSLQQGVQSALSDLIDRYQDKMFRYAKRFFNDKEDAQDLVQDVFLKVYVNINSFDTRAKFSSWIYRIAHNTFVNKIAWKSIRRTISLDADEIFTLQIPSVENVERESIKREEKEEMEKHLELLDEKYRTPLILFFYQDLSYEEISEVLKIPINTVGIRILRGKEKLKKHLSKND